MRGEWTLLDYETLPLKLVIEHAMELLQSARGFVDTYPDDTRVEHRIKNPQMRETPNEWCHLLRCYFSGLHCGRQALIIQVTEEGQGEVNGERINPTYVGQLLCHLTHDFTEKTLQRIIEFKGNKCTCHSCPTSLPDTLWADASSAPGSAAHA